MKVFMIEPNKCTGCHLCEMVCSYKHHNLFSIELSNIKIESNEDIAFNVPTKCMQCEKAYCMKSCVAGAIARNENTGAMEVDRNKCIGCKACIMACPFGSMSLISKNSRLEIGICDLCGGDPECIKVCRDKALSYMDSSRINKAKRENTLYRLTVMDVEGHFNSE